MLILDEYLFLLQDGKVIDKVKKLAKSSGGTLAGTIASGLAVGGALQGASALSKRSSARGVCKDKYKSGTPQFRACMYRLIHK